MEGGRESLFVSLFVSFTWKLRAKRICGGEGSAFVYVGLTVVGCLLFSFVDF